MNNAPYCRACPLVARLMQLADIKQITPNGLRAAYVANIEKNREALEWLRMSLDRLLIMEASAA